MGLSLLHAPIAINHLEVNKKLSDIRIHTGEKPFACGFCSYAANAKGNLHQHIAKYHDDISKS